MNDTTPIWRPSAEGIARANLTRFQTHAARYVAPGDYAALWQWSVDDPAAFWNALFDFTGVIADRGTGPVLLDGDRMPPGNILNRNAQRGGQALPLKWSRRIVAGYNGADELRVETRLFDELLKRDSGLFDIVGERLHDSPILPRKREHAARGCLAFAGAPFDRFRRGHPLRVCICR